MRVRARAATCAVLIAAGGTTAVAIGSDSEKLRTGLTGLEEVPVVFTTGDGTFTARLSPSENRIDYEFSYGGLEGGEVRQAHIHTAQRNVNGAILVWFCGSTTNPGPTGTPTCPPSGTLTGSFEPDDVQVVPAQGFRGSAAARFEKFVQALRSGLAYANVHTADSPGGEIRGQIEARQDG